MPQKQWSDERKAEWSAFLKGRPRRKQLPDMTKEQHNLYCKLRWRAGYDREQALAVIFG